MSNRGMPTGQKKVGVFVLLVLGAALAGTTATTVIGPSSLGIHPDCEDGIDNDGDGGLDANDWGCVSYPWSDGMGEMETPQPQWGLNSGGYTSTTFAWWSHQYVIQTGQANACNQPMTDYNFFLDNGAIYATKPIYQPAPWWDGSDAEEQIYRTANGCP